MGNSLSATLVEHYRSHGYVFPVPALTSAEAADIRTGIEDFERRSGLVAGQVIRDKGHLKLTRLYDLIFHPQVLDAVESVLGPDILCYRYGYFAKDPVPTRDMDPDIVAFVDRRHGSKPLGAGTTATWMTNRTMSLGKT